LAGLNVCIACIVDGTIIVEQPQVVGSACPVLIEPREALNHRSAVTRLGLGGNVDKTLNYFGGVWASVIRQG
jgi:hypothetical protein